MSTYFRVLKKYMAFRGRATRQEYWTFFLWNLVIGLGLCAVAGVVAFISERKDPDEIIQTAVAVANILFLPYCLFTLLPSLAVGVRRLHDSGHRGWWILVPFANILFLLFPSQPFDNRYGKVAKSCASNVSDDSLSKSATIASLLVILALTAAPNSSAQDIIPGEPNARALTEISEFVGWGHLPGTHAWAVEGISSPFGRRPGDCLAILDRLQVAGVPDTRQIRVKYDTPEFQKGPHSLRKIRESCMHVQMLFKISAFQRWGILAMQEAPKVSSGHYDGVYFRNCIQAYDQAIKNGVPPTQDVSAKVVYGVEWSGSIEDLRKRWCDPGLSQAKVDNAAKERPYREALKNDRLAVALNYEEVVLPGGVRTSNPRKMAAASTWFVDFEQDHICTDGRKINMVRRYQFNTDQRIVTKNEQQYCGPAPLTAFR